MNVSQIFTSFVLLYLAEFVSISQERNELLSPFYVKTTAIECYGNPDLLVNITCRLKPINWEKTVAIMDSDLVGVIRNASLRLELFKYTNQFRPFLVNLTLNLCNMLDTGHGSTYAKMAVNLFSHFTSINHGCPYWGHLAAYGIYLDPRFIPFFVPSAKYKLVFTFFEGWPFVHIGTVGVSGIVAERRDMPKTKPKIRPNRTLVGER